MRPNLWVALPALLLLAGCAQEKKNADSGPAPAPAPTTTSTPPTTTTDPGRGTVPSAPPSSSTGTTGTYNSGGTVELKASTSALGQLFYNSRPNSPTEIKINIDLSRETESVIVSYKENGKFYEAAFGVTHPDNTSIKDTRYNGWVGSVWKGFFQDHYGAVILVLDEKTSVGDGSGTYFIGGRVYFQNFNQYYPNNPNQGPLKVCWDISYGPYDCRSFIVNNSVNDSVDMASSLNPNNKGPTRDVGYQLLGNFSGLSSDAAGL